MLRFSVVLVYAIVALLCSVAGSSAHDGVKHAFQSKVLTLLRQQLPDIPGSQIVSSIYEVQPGTEVPTHVHAGDVFHFVLEGQWAAAVQDRETRLMKEGDSQFVPRGKWHGGKVVGDHLLRLLAVMIVDSDKPLSTMVDPY
jgi:quercetin dioxygenase-like cupin family protein